MKIKAVDAPEMAAIVAIILMLQSIVQVELDDDDPLSASSL